MRLGFVQCSAEFYKDVFVKPLSTVSKKVSKQLQIINVEDSDIDIKLLLISCKKFDVLRKGHNIPYYVLYFKDKIGLDKVERVGL